MKYRRLIRRDEIYTGIELWNKEQPKFQIITPLIEQNIYAPFTGVNSTGWGCYHNQELIAFGLAKYLTRPMTPNSNMDLGWISLFTISGQVSERVKIGQELLNHLEVVLRDQGVKKISFGADPQNYLPGLPEEMESDYLPLFKKTGYRVAGEVYDLYADLQSDFIPSPRVIQVKKEWGTALTAKPVKKEEEDVLLEFLRNNFSGRWYYEADNIRRLPGGVEDYWLLWYETTPVGFVRTNTSQSAYLGPNVNWGNRWGERYCGLGPIGISKDFRKKGWGLALITDVISSFQEQNYQHMLIDWTELIDYYGKLGFKPVIRYLSLYHDLDLVLPELAEE